MTTALKQKRVRYQSNPKAVNVYRQTARLTTKTDLDNTDGQVLTNTDGQTLENTS